MEMSSTKRPNARTLPSFYDDHHDAIASFMLWSAARTVARGADCS